MNLIWTNLTLPQRRALAILLQEGPCPLPVELGEQLLNLGLAERADGPVFCISALGTTIRPETLH